MLYMYKPYAAIPPECPYNFGVLDMTFRSFM